ncbi:MAG: FAD-binding oxidoreductase [Mucilaginibacter sp.]
MFSNNMEQHVVKILGAEFVTHNVRRFTIERPADYVFTSGQATDVSINKPGLEDELRPFTFTSLNNETDHLEFTIKIYKDHHGITAKLGELTAGDELILHEVFGVIEYRRPGLFIAGGAGVTPFISILRQAYTDGKMEGNTLLFANHTDQDIILKDEFKAMLGDNFINVIKEPNGRHIDQELLKGYAGKYENYYVCGPDEFTAAMIENLKQLGVAESEIVYEH